MRCAACRALWLPRNPTGEPDSNSSSESDVRVPGRPRSQSERDRRDGPGPTTSRVTGSTWLPGGRSTPNRAIDDSKDVGGCHAHLAYRCQQERDHQRECPARPGLRQCHGGTRQDVLPGCGQHASCIHDRRRGGRCPVHVLTRTCGGAVLHVRQQAVRERAGSHKIHRRRPQRHDAAPADSLAQCGARTSLSGRRTADERLEEFYKPDQQHARLFSAGAILAIAIACLGLYGLAAFSTTRRVREIGIRKTLGASTRDVLLLLIGQFVRPVLIANVIAWPLAWAAMRAWLSGFDERVALSPLYFVASGVGALVLSTATVAAQAWRVAHAEPARALRYE